MRTVRDALVVGGGPAGAALAVRLCQAGRRVVLIERTVGAHHKVCGEFLSHESLLHLQALGLDPVALGAVPIETLLVSSRNRSATIRLPYAAMSLSRRILDEAILSRAVDVGAEVLRGSAAKALTFERGRWRTRLECGKIIAANAAFLATGKHDLRGWQRSRGIRSDLIGFKMHWQLQPAMIDRLARSVALHLFPGGYAGLEPVEGDRANLCLLVRRRCFHDLGCDWDALLRYLSAWSPGLARSLDGAQPCWPRPLAVGAVPFGHVRTDSGPWPLGDQVAVVPSFTGTGIGVALESAHRAADVYLGGGTVGDYKHLFVHQIGGLARYGGLMSSLLVSGPTQRALVAILGLQPQWMAWYAAALHVTGRSKRRSK